MHLIASHYSGVWDGNLKIINGTYKKNSQENYSSNVWECDCFRPDYYKIIVGCLQNYDEYFIRIKKVDVIASCLIEDEYTTLIHRTVKARSSRIKAWKPCYMGEASWGSINSIRFHLWSRYHCTQNFLILKIVKWQL